MKISEIKNAIKDLAKSIPRPKFVDLPPRPTLSDVMALPHEQVMQMDIRQLKAATRTIGDVANKRLRVFEKKGTSTFASTAFEKSGGRVKIGGKNINQLRKEFIRAKQFVSAEGSTQKGYIEEGKKLVAALDKMGLEVDADQAREIFKKWEMLKEHDPSVAHLGYKYEIINTLAEQMEAKYNPDTLLERMDEKIKELYEASDEMKEYFSAATLMDDLVFEDEE